MANFELEPFSPRRRDPTIVRSHAPAPASGLNPSLLEGEILLDNTSGGLLADTGLNPSLLEGEILRLLEYSRMLEPRQA